MPTCKITVYTAHARYYLHKDGNIQLVQQLRSELWYYAQGDRVHIFQVHCIIAGPTVHIGHYGCAGA